MIRPLRNAALVAAATLSATAGTPRTAPAQADAPRTRLLVTADWLGQHLHDPDLVLLHVGDPEDYAKEHIPGAVFVNVRADLSAPRPEGGTGLVLELPSAEVLQASLRAMGISDRSRIVIYWGSEWVTPTTRALFALQWAGLGDHTALLDGGIEAWKVAKGALTGDAPIRRVGDVTVHPQPDLVVDADWVRQHTGAAGYRVLDARAAAFYDGVREDQGKSGHIPGAGSLPWTQLVDEQLHLKSPEELRRLFAAAGVQPGDTVVTYCHIGQYATAVLFAARTLGYPVRLYDGAFQDWATRGLPVETP